MSKVKVLYFVDRMLRGGIQSLVIDWVSRLDKAKIQVDFLLLDDGVKYELEDTLRELGCNVYKLDGIWIRKPSDFIKYRKAVDNFFDKHNDYKAVHLNSSSKNYYILKSAYKHNIPIRIAHSHNNDFQTTSSVKKLVGNMMKPKLIKYSTDFFACSKLAGEWLFGKEIVKKDKFKVIHNAVDYDKFKFNEKTRDRIRKEYNIDKNTVVIGCVGRFAPQKNHLFLIDIFNEYCKLNNNSKLMLVGQGDLENDIKDRIKEYHLEDNVIFTGYKNDTWNYYQAFDIFVLPSNFEGLGMVLIEAQCSGMPCFTSKDVVPEEAKATNLLTYISLDKTAEEWAKEISKADIKRINTYEDIRKNKYYLDDVVKELESIYLGD